MADLLNEITAALKIHTLDKNQKIWFFRTNGGEYYCDYCLNNYIALGWDKVSKAYITDSNFSSEQKKDRIGELYPDELRPGLIFGQLNSFYNKMNVGDLVLIPSQGGKQVCIGTLGDLTDEINHLSMEDEYSCCSYSHKRKVNWIKKIESWQDVYLFKELRAQQTISDITSSSGLVYRNLYSAYAANHSVHLTLQKKTKSDYSLISNMDLCSSIISISTAIAKLYEEKDIVDSIKIKTAVGSPGFIEIIMPYVLTSPVVIGIIVKAVIGKTKTDNKTTSSGILGIIETVNKLINDHYSRKKADAETRLLDAETRKTIAEARRIEQGLVAPNKQAIEDSIDTVQKSCEKLQSTTLSAGLVFTDVSEEEKAG